MIVIGLSGYAQSGKDSVADILARDHGFTRRAFADKLREALYALDPHFGWSSVTYARLIDELGYEAARRTQFGPEIRRLLQRMGTEVGRGLFGESFWVDQALAGIEPGGRYVFTDCRFANEAQSIVDVGGQVWRVWRPGVVPVNDHPSEVGLDGWPFDRVIDNDGTLNDLALYVSASLVPA